MDPPTAMLDKQGNFLISDSSITNRALEVYSERLANNEIKLHFGTNSGKSAVVVWKNLP